MDYQDPNPFSTYTLGMASHKDFPMAVEWQDAARKTLAADTSAASCVATLVSAASARALLAQVRDAYETPPQVLSRIAAVSRFSLRTPPGRAVWTEALLDCIENASVEYVRLFCLDQLRWCGTRGQAARLRVLRGPKAVCDLADFVAGELETRSEPKTRRLGVQAYSVRELLKRDLAGTMAQLAKAGFAGVELWNLPAFDVTAVGAALRASGLAACGVHVFEDELSQKNLERTLDAVDAVGARCMILPWLDVPERASAEWWTSRAALLNAAAAAAKPRGIAVGYHHHDFEFRTRVGDRTAWGILMEAFSPEIFIQWDVGALAHADEKPVDWLRRYPGRCPTLHLKDDWGGEKGKVKGEGVVGAPPKGRPGVNWQDVAKFIGEYPPEWLIVETASADSLDPVFRSREAVRKLGLA